MLDLIDDANKEPYPAGLGPQFAQSVASEVQILIEDAAGCRPAYWAGVIGFAGVSHAGDQESWLLRFEGPLSVLGDKIAKEETEWADGYSEISVHRMFLANATRAAKFVRSRAAELGIAEGAGLEGNS